MNFGKLPVVDFQFIQNIDITQDFDNCKYVADKLRNALSSVGFAYLINHGIPENVTNSIFHQTKLFFNTSTEIKMKYRKDTTSSKDVVMDLKNNFGYVPPGNERLYSDNEYELKEIFDCVPAYNIANCPTEVPNLHPSLETFAKHCKTLYRKLLQLLAVGLNLEINFFVDHCRHLEEPNKYSGMDIVRLLHYPAIVDNSSAKPGTVRCGEHSDFMFLTLLFQDNVGGLQVKTVDGDWIHAEPIPNSVIVNTADITEFWTCGIFPATIHKIVIPNVDDKQRRDSRYSVIYFGGPESDAVLQPIDVDKRPHERERIVKSGMSYNKEPVVAMNYLLRKLAKMNGVDIE